MADEVEHYQDSSLPTISTHLKPLFSDLDFYAPLSDLPATNRAVAVVQDTPAVKIQMREEGTDGLNITDGDLENLFAIVESFEPSVNPFSILPSKKDRGKTYFIDLKEKILTTKRNEAIHLRLDNCRGGQKVLLTLRYADKDYYDRPMVCNSCSHAYKSCSSSEDHNTANFCVKSRDATVEYEMLAEGDSFHPTAIVTLTETGQVNFFAAFKCRNSCSEHKKYGCDRTLRLILLNDFNEEVCRDEWSLRVCESPKRDHKLGVSKAGAEHLGSVAYPSMQADPRQLTPVPVRVAVTDINPAPMKRVKTEEEPVVHYIDAAAASSTQQLLGAMPSVQQSVPAFATPHNSQANNIHYNSYGLASSTMSSTSNTAYAGKKLVPIAPPTTVVAPVIVYPKTEADKKLLRDLALRLSMNIYDVKA